MICDLYGTGVVIVVELSTKTSIVVIDSYRDHATFRKARALSFIWYLRILYNKKNVKNIKYINNTILSIINKYCEISTILR